MILIITNIPNSIPTSAMRVTLVYSNDTCPYKKGTVKPANTNANFDDIFLKKSKILGNVLVNVFIISGLSQIRIRTILLRNPICNPMRSYFMYEFKCKQN